MNKTPSLLSHDARLARRRAIAQAVRAAGGQTHGIAMTFGVSQTTVHFACAECGVAIQPRRSGKSSTYALIAALFDAGRTMDAIAREFGVTAQRIGNVYRDCRRAGVPVPQRHTGPCRRPEGDHGNPENCVVNCGNGG
jgi:hypothetical protein